MFPENKTENVFSTFHHQEIPRRNSICSVTAWPFMKNKNCLSFFTRKNFNKILNLSVALFSCFLTANIVYIYYYFRWLSWPFLRARPSQFIYSALSSFFAWCRACGSGTKDICTLQHGFPCFPLFLCIFIIFLALSHMYIILIPSARSLRFGSRLWKVNIDQNWNPFLSLFVSENPCYL